MTGARAPDAVAEAAPATIRDARIDAAARELDEPVRLGEPRRVHDRRGTADGATRALFRVAPTLVA